MARCPSARPKTAKTKNSGASGGPRLKRAEIVDDMQPASFAVPQSETISSAILCKQENGLRGLC